MPKIRGVKPEFWTDEGMVELSIPARLLFIGLWNYACDNGHLQDKPKQIKMRILPADDVNATELLRELEAKGCIVRADGWITVPNLTKHQRPDRRYFTGCDKAGCEVPEQTVSQRESRRVHAVQTPGTPSAPTVRTECARVDGDGDGDGDGDRAVTKRTSGKRATRLPDDFTPTEQHVALANQLGVDLRREWPKFRDYWQGEGKPKADWNATLRTWIRKASEDPRRAPAAAGLRLAPSGEPYIPLALDDRR